MAIIETRTVSLETNRGMNDLLSMKKERVKVDETQEILDWLTRLDFDKERHDLLLRQKANTGKWFIESPEFRAWVETKKQTLLCHGFPGVGKTMLAAIAIDEIFKTTKAKDDGNGYQFLNNTNTGGYEDDNVGIGYVFGNFRRADELTCVAILASLTRQLAEKKDLPSDVLKMFKKHKSERSRPRLDELVSTLISIASRHATVFVVVDALDELHPDERASLTSALFSIQRGKADFRILATSRIIPEIVSEFKDAQHLEIRASEEDISTYLDGKMPGLPLFVRRNPELQEEIKSKINMAVDGV
jgi:DNA polymerase III delta prime subunit